MCFTNKLFCQFLLFCGLVVLQASTLFGQETVTSDGIEQAKRDQIVRAGVEYLLEKGQTEDGSFSKHISPAVTAMCTNALLDHGVPLSHPKVQLALKFLESYIQPDGGIYAPGSGLQNYETSISVMCLLRANKEDKYDKTIQDAVGYLKIIQWDEGEEHEQLSKFYGGLGYGKHKRPDMSNAQIFMDALKAAGEDKDSAAIQKALVFVSRAQNLPSEHNVSKWAAKTTADDKGGFIYTPVGEGESKPGKTDGGGLRSYGSMTYAGLKSFLYAGVDKDDIRVQAAMDWIRRHYDLKTNPGMGQQGLFYYYHVFAKTLGAVGEPVLIDSDGVKHNWRNDLIEQLAKLQNKDGSWTNEHDRWYEGDPNLVTAYAMLSLSYCK